MQQKYLKGALQIEGYKDQLPFKSPYWMRPDDPGSELHPPRRYGNRTENERLIKSIRSIAGRIDHAEKDCKMLTYPTWKSDYGTKPKWKTARGFDLATESFGTKITDNTAWK